MIEGKVKDLPQLSNLLSIQAMKFYDLGLQCCGVSNPSIELYGFDSGIEPVSARIDPEAVSRIKLATKIWENLESESVQ